MKKTLKHIVLFLSIVLSGTFAACQIEEETASEDTGLSIKVFFPTKVVAGQDMTINGSGFQDVVGIVFPGSVNVTDFTIVNDQMIRVTAPKGISSEGGKISVVTTTEQAESRLPLTLGSTRISGYSKQEGEKIQGGEQLTVYGSDLEFVSSVELIDEDGNPLVIQDEDFYRKGTSNIVFTIPQNIFTGSFVGKVATFDGKTFSMPEIAYEPAPTGHWETIKTSIWKNDGSHGAISWSGEYRFSSESASTGEEIYAVPQELWDQMKSGSFYLLAQGSDWVQMRITTGWWTTTWTGNDISTGDERIIDNGDGTYCIEINFSGDPILDVIDQQHLLLTGGGYTPLELYFEKTVWVENGSGPKQVVFWENDGSKGAISWSGDYRFGLEGNDGRNECLATFPTDVWEKLKSGSFYLLAQGSDWVQIRITTGWWTTTWTGDDISTGDERIIDNGDGTFCIEINFSGDPILDLLDQQHLLLTGGGYTPLKLYFYE